MADSITLEHPKTGVRVLIAREYLQTFFHRRPGPQRRILAINIEGNNNHTWSRDDEIRVLSNHGWRPA